MTYPSTSIIRWLDRWPTLPEATCRTPSSWATALLLSRFGSPSDAALAVRRSDNGSAVFAELVVRSDHTSTLAALAGIAPRLSAVRWHWWTSGTPEAELDDLESELITECISLMRSQPELPPCALVRSARYRVFGRRRTERARCQRHRELRPDAMNELVAGMPDTPLLRLLHPREASALWLWACGWKTKEAAEILGATPQVIRARRSRGIRTLRASTEVVA